MQIGKNRKMSLDNMPLILFKYQRGESNGGEEALAVGVLKPSLSFLEAEISPGIHLIIASPNKVRVFDKISI
jgi:hypothetical protein